MLGPKHVCGLIHVLHCQPGDARKSEGRFDRSRVWGLDGGPRRAQPPRHHRGTTYVSCSSLLEPETAETRNPKVVETRNPKVVETRNPRSDPGEIGFRGLDGDPRRAQPPRHHRGTTHASCPSLLEPHTAETPSPKVVGTRNPKVVETRNLKLVETRNLKI